MLGILGSQLSPKPKIQENRRLAGFEFVSLTAAVHLLPQRFLFLCAVRVVVKFMIPCWILSIIRHLVFRGTKRGP